VTTSSPIRRSTESTLVLPSALRGRITVVDKTGRVAVELTKDAGEPLSLALPNETYSVHVARRLRLRQPARDGRHPLRGHRHRRGPVARHSRGAGIKSADARGSARTDQHAPTWARFLRVQLGDGDRGSG